MRGAARTKCPRRPVRYQARYAFGYSTVIVIFSLTTGGSWGMCR